jgi:O-acetyl-ADP-ribose deacetylase (regulator of RNase III)
MPVTFVKGDLFHTEGVHAYANGCNASGAMDAGVAAAFKKRFPRMFDEYRQRCEDGRFSLGDVFVWSEGDEVVYNLAIQQNWKTRSKLPALSRAVRKMAKLAEQSGVKRVGLPRLGAGLGGLDWRRVKSVLEEVGGETSIELVVFEQFIRAESEAPPGHPEAQREIAAPPASERTEKARDEQKPKSDGATRPSRGRKSTSRRGAP